MNTNQSGGELVLTLTQANGGTRVSSTRYAHYGTITTRSKFRCGLMCVNLELRRVLFFVLLAIK